MNEIRQNDHDDQEDEPIDEKHDNQSADISVLEEFLGLE